MSDWRRDPCPVDLAPGNRQASATFSRWWWLILWAIPTQTFLGEEHEDWRADCRLLITFKRTSWRTYILGMRWAPNPPPFHPNCRCLITPILPRPEGQLDPAVLAHAGRQMAESLAAREDDVIMGQPIQTWAITRWDRVRLALREARRRLALAWRVLLTGDDGSDW